MSVNTNNAYGKISISDLAIAKVASHTAMESYGIVEMVSRRFTDSLSVLFQFFRNIFYFLLFSRCF